MKMDMQIDGLIWNANVSCVKIFFIGRINLISK